MPDLNNTPDPINNLSTPQVQQNPFQGKIQSFTPDKPLYMSPLGTPVMQDITFGSIDYIDTNTGKQLTTKPLTLINILFKCSRSKNIVITSIQGRNGTIKEYVGEDDWEVTINGIIAGTPGHHPADEILALKTQIIVNVPIPVTCTYLNNLGITNLVVKEVLFNQEAGGYSTQNFTLNCLSDADVILTIL